MAGVSSGVDVSKETLELADALKFHKNDQKMKNVCAFKFELDGETKSKKHIIVPDPDLNVEDPADLLKSNFLPLDSPRYVLADLGLVKDGLKKTDLVSIAWCPDTCNVKEKMVFASSKNDFMKKLEFISVSVKLAVGSVEDLRYELERNNCDIAKN